MRIRSADYTTERHDSTNNTLQNVTVTNCCRGIRLQDSTAMYVKNFQVENLNAGGIYFAVHIPVLGYDGHKGGWLYCQR